MKVGTIIAKEGRPLFKCCYYEKERIPIQEYKNALNRIMSEESGQVIEWCTHRDSPYTRSQALKMVNGRNALMCGGDVFSLQRILGHSSLDAVRVYVNMAQADIKAAHQRFSPADNMKLSKG